MGNEVAADQLDSVEKQLRDEVCAGIIRQVAQFRDSYTGPHGNSKYLQQTAPHVAHAAKLSGYFSAIQNIFEIGPGPGFLLAVLRAQGKTISGCDVRSGPDDVFVQMRSALGVQPFVIQHRVVAFQPIPVSPGMEGLAAITTGIDRRWGMREHEWFLAECAAKLCGRKRLVFGFQFPDPMTPVQRFYRRIGLFPIAKGSICVVDL